MERLGEIKIMELSERLNLLLGMKERPEESYYRAYDNDTAIVNSQSESEMAAQFATQQSHLEFSISIPEFSRGKSKPFQG